MLTFVPRRSSANAQRTLQTGGPGADAAPNSRPDVTYAGASHVYANFGRRGQFSSCKTPKGRNIGRKTGLFLKGNRGYFRHMSVSKLLDRVRRSEDDALKVFQPNPRL